MPYSLPLWTSSTGALKNVWKCIRRVSRFAVPEKLMCVDNKSTGDVTDEDADEMKKTSIAVSNLSTWNNMPPTFGQNTRGSSRLKTVRNYSLDKLQRRSVIMRLPSTVYRRSHVWAYRMASSRRALNTWPTSFVVLFLLVETKNKQECLVSHSLCFSLLVFLWMMDGASSYVSKRLNHCNNIIW